MPGLSLLTASAKAAIRPKSGSTTLWTSSNIRLRLTESIGDADKAEYAIDLAIGPSRLDNRPSNSAINLPWPFREEDTKRIADYEDDFKAERWLPGLRLSLQRGTFSANLEGSPDQPLLQFPIDIRQDCQCDRPVLEITISGLLHVMWVTFLAEVLAEEDTMLLVGESSHWDQAATMYH
ncbi:hypothetical protein QCA50_018568 [Cerrena zonata]|uniref:Uncharacterized protein n=1 Tax=Cerrena zonata TaxID=2478898 RepID=A0AAW0FML8_9APHY